ncbi:unnamed protein product, partial [Urochloa humidicola]
PSKPRASAVFPLSLLPLSFLRPVLRLPFLCAAPPFSSSSGPRRPRQADHARRRTRVRRRYRSKLRKRESECIALLLGHLSDAQQADEKGEPRRSEGVR